VPATWANVAFDVAAGGEAVFSAPEGLHPAANKIMNTKLGHTIFIDFMEAKQNGFAPHVQFNN
jgi:hypothetical protein